MKRLVLIMNVNFNETYNCDECIKYIEDSIITGHTCGDGKYTKLCAELMEKKFNANKILLTTSCTSALEMACLLIDLKPGDEVIMPSYTFSSTAGAVVLMGATPVFIDVKKEDMNINSHLIEQAITKKTKAIIPVHYAGVACDMDHIMEIATKHSLYVIEDAAQGVNSTYHDNYLGTIGHFGCFSFHETKNYSMGEGGALLINDDSFINRATSIRDAGTNRTMFKNGLVDEYSWVERGSSYLPSDILAAYLYHQLLNIEIINQDRIRCYNRYMNNLYGSNYFELPISYDEGQHNAHLFFIKVENIEKRTALQLFLKDKGIGTAFHYIPLHSSIAGKKYGRFSGEDINTTRESERLLRLPMYFGLEDEKIDYVCDSILEFFTEGENK